MSDNFKFDENSRKLSKRVENTVGKGEIARYKQYLLFPQCCQKACFPGVSKGVIVWEWVKEFAYNNFKFYENGKKFPKRIEIARYEWFLLFPQSFPKVYTANT